MAVKHRRVSFLKELYDSIPDYDIEHQDNSSDSRTDDEMLEWSLYPRKMSYKSFCLPFFFIVILSVFGLPCALIFGLYSREMKFNNINVHHNLEIIKSQNDNNWETVRMTNNKVIQRGNGYFSASRAKKAKNIPLRLIIAFQRLCVASASLSLSFSVRDKFKASSFSRSILSFILSLFQSRRSSVSSLLAL